jgi:hypothetical protein
MAELKSLARPTAADDLRCMISLLGLEALLRLHKHLRVPWYVLSGPALAFAPVPNFLVPPLSGDFAFGLNQQKFGLRSPFRRGCAVL